MKTTLDDPADRDTGAKQLREEIPVSGANAASTGGHGADANTSGHGFNHPQGGSGGYADATTYPGQGSYGGLSQSAVDIKGDAHSADKLAKDKSGSKA